MWYYRNRVLASHRAMVCHKEKLILQGAFQSRVRSPNNSIFVGNVLCMYFDFRLMRMHEHGLNSRENARMYTKKPRCVGTAGNFITG